LGLSRSPSIESVHLAAAAAHLADQKKGLDVRVLEVGPQIKLVDYFVLCSASSRPQVKAILNEIRMRLKAAGVPPPRVEGTETGWWVLLDFGDVLVHVMQPEAREYYDLDGLYGECREVEWQDLVPPELVTQGAPGQAGRVSRARQARPVSLPAGQRMV
jgi:ribosome-associated protein